MAMAMNAILILLLTIIMTQILNVAMTIIIFIEIMSMTKDGLVIMTTTNTMIIYCKIFS